MRKRNTYLVIIYILCGIVISTSLLAQKPNYKFKSIRASDGLINSTVQAVFEDSYGFIWFGTHHGLQRYDGKTFTNFVSEGNDDIGLSHNYINDFCEDVNGDIWIATGRGLNRYSRIQDRIFQYQWSGDYAKDFDDLGGLNVQHDNQDSDIIWLSGGGSKLIKLNIQNKNVDVFIVPGDNTPTVLMQMKHPNYQNHLLIGTTELFLFDKKTAQFRSLVSLEQSHIIPNNRFNNVAFDPTDHNILWCATGDIWGRGELGGLIRYNLETGESKLFSWENRPGEIPDRHILTVCFYDDTKLFVGTRNYGLLLYDIAKDRFYNYQYNEYDEGSFVTENAIRSMHLDRSGTMWFGTWGDGISILSPALQKFAHYKHLPGITDGLPDNWITGITEDLQGNIWIGTKAGGLAKFNPQDKTFEHHFQEFIKPNEDPTEITYVFTDSHNKLWIGTYAHALYRYDHEIGVKRHYPEGNTTGSVSQKRISAIAELVPGEILISTYGGGLNIYQYNSDSFKQYLNNPDDSTSIPDNQIWLPFLGDDGNYYFGGNSRAGLIKFNPKNENFSEPILRQDFNTFLVSVKNNTGRIFVSVLSHGLSELLLEDPVTFTTLSDNEGHPIVGTESAVIDNRNQFWLGTSKGLLKYDPKTKKLTRYDPDDGLQGYDFYRFAAYLSSSGTMYFGGLNGLNTFNPEEIQLSNYKPPVVLTGFKVFQEELKIGPNLPLKKNILLVENIELSYAQNDFSISFSGLDYTNPHKIQYKYKLVNHDEDWIHAGNFGAAGYTNMDPGKYFFQVISTNADGVWNDKVKSLQIIIHPPWWQTNMAYIIYGLFFILGVIIIDRFQRKRLKEKAKAKAREKELKQAQEIKKAYDKLKTTQSQLVHAEKMASLGELTAGIAHEIQNPLNFINNFSEVNTELITELNEEIDKGDLKEVKSIAKDIAGNEEKIMHHGKRADGIVKGMLQHSRSNGNEKIPTNINALADEYLRLSYHGLRAKDKSFNADFKAELDENLPKLKVVGQDIARVVLNLINNAFYAVSDRAKQNKDGYKPLVVVSTKKLEDKVEIKVKDNGNGIPADVLEKIFQPFFTTKSAGEGTGLGLSLSYDIITNGHGGELKVETKENEGSEFVICLPLS